MGLGDIFFPEICPVCKRALVGEEKYVCLRCFIDLPYSHFWSWRDNPAEVMLKELMSIEAAVSLFVYRRESGWKDLIYKFKYRNDKILGRWLSKLLGEKLVESGMAEDIDMIVPVPLHPLKKWKRGFNQTEVIAKELGKILWRASVEKNVLKRVRYSSSQTVKGRQTREAAVSGAFVLSRCSIEGKHILLVDDVLTTGATLTACGREILSVPRTKLTIATLAYVE